MLQTCQGIFWLALDEPCLVRGEELRLEAALAQVVRAGGDERCKASSARGAACLICPSNA